VLYVGEDMLSDASPNLPVYTLGYPKEGLLSQASPNKRAYTLGVLPSRPSPAEPGTGLHNLSPLGTGTQ